jgi:hypothetical protein
MVFILSGLSIGSAIIRLLSQKFQKNNERKRDREPGNIRISTTEYTVTQRVPPSAENMGEED